MHCGCPQAGKTVGQKLFQLMSQHVKNVPPFLRIPDKSVSQYATHPSDHNAVYFLNDGGTSDSSREARLVELNQRRQRETRKVEWDQVPSFMVGNHPGGDKKKKNEYTPSPGPTPPLLDLSHPPAFLFPIYAEVANCTAASGNVIDSHHPALAAKCRVGEEFRIPGVASAIVAQRSISRGRKSRSNSVTSGAEGAGGTRPGVAGASSSAANSREASRMGRDISRMESRDVSRMGSRDVSRMGRDASRMESRDVSRVGSRDASRVGRHNSRIESLDVSRMSSREVSRVGRHHSRIESLDVSRVGSREVSRMGRHNSRIESLDVSRVGSRNVSRVGRHNPRIESLDISRMDSRDVSRMASRDVSRVASRDVSRLRSSHHEVANGVVVVNGVGETGADSEGSVAGGSNSVAGSSKAMGAGDGAGEAGVEGEAGEGVEGGAGIVEQVPLVQAIPLAVQKKPEVSSNWASERVEGPNGDLENEPNAEGSGSARELESGWMSEVLNI
jgi:hypothetical protein